MRNEMEAVIKDVFKNLALKTRYERGLTQEKMAAALVMNERSYWDIECGNYSCGTLTTILLLLEVENLQETLDELRVLLQRAYEMEVVEV